MMPSSSPFIIVDGPIIFLVTMVASLMLSRYRNNGISSVTRVLQHSIQKRGKCQCLPPSSGALRPFSSNSPSRKTLIGSSRADDDSLNSLWIPIIGGFLVATAGGMKYIHDHVGGTEGMKRSVSFYSLAIPKYIEYRWHMWRNSPDHVWEQLDHDTSQVGLKKLKELRGFYIKCGQICAANIGNAFPPIWIETMAELQDKVPHEDYRTIQRIISSELDMKSVFATFEKEPIGSAAIGQVHRATLKDGTPVVVKVRYPEVERLLRGDVRTITMFAQVAQPVHVPALQEIEHQFMTEFDYVQEAQQMEAVRHNLTKAGLAGPGKKCRVPKAYLEYCTKQVLVMEELKGEKLAVALQQDLKQQAQRQGKTAEEFVKEIKQQEREAKARGEELMGPTAKEYDLYISLLDQQRKASNVLSVLHKALLGWWLPGSRSPSRQDKSFLPINHAKMIDDLIYIHGHEVLVDGLFNGDPHPGNILMIRDEDGTPALGLIDYGQVKRLSKETRLTFAKLIIALDDDNRDEAARLIQQLGLKTKHMDPDVHYQYAKVSYDQDNMKLLGGKHIQVYMEDLEAKDPIQQLPKELIMVSRASIILRGLAHALHQNRSVAKIWRPIAEKVLREEG